ncbi:putative secreted protein (Por secretion system target) [Chryseobacterium sp. 52]|uniref:T9SS type A sorting domain-containing protein n=1 Tax=Chryseobacterium sp. 52 TaxID=2035213 RepID=UPI000C180287|nr:T9SS type A sorting domain-containing protein [Chryseobacterium sp. 52]PIF47677.1 putative secreted protein (Por secretion system target) [Chryseobacterium sp. 52]
MKYFKFTFLFFITVSSFLTAQTAPAIEWGKSLGGNYIELSPDIYQTSDGGYITAGASNSQNGDVTGNHGSLDYWVVKLESNGNIQWQKSFGGTADDQAHSVRQTADGGYIVAGSTESTNGQVTGNHGNNDYWVIKLDASGSLEWQKTLGGSSNDIARSVRQTSDGGYIVAGSSSSSNGDISGNHGGSDYWIVKLTSTGNIQWEKSLGGNNSDDASSIAQTTDNGYIIAGTSSSNNGDVTGNHGDTDYWVVKINSAGVLQWQKSLGGSSTETGQAIAQTQDSGYIVAGSSSSDNGDITGNHGSFDYWVVKLNSAGNLQWQKSFGEIYYDYAFDIKNTNDGGYIVSGFSESTAIKGFGSNDYWMIKLLPDGNIEWDKKLGGLTDDYATAAQQTADGGYVISGFSNSVTPPPALHYNYWIVKLLGNKELGIAENSGSNTSVLYPNPAKDIIYIDHLSGETLINITDMSGRKLFSQKFTDKKVAIDTSPFINGVYMIQVQDKGKIILSDKLIIKK